MTMNTWFLTAVLSWRNNWRITQMTWVLRRRQVTTWRITGALLFRNTRRLDNAPNRAHNLPRVDYSQVLGIMLFGSFMGFSGKLVVTWLRGRFFFL